MVALLKSLLLVIPVVLVTVLCSVLMDDQEVELLVPAPGPDPTPVDCPSVSSDSEAIARFTQLLRFRTVSNADLPNALESPAEFDAMLSFLAEAYAPLWAHLEVEQVGPGGYSRMLTWRGVDPALLPVLFVSHYDVVPVHVPQNWTHPPFSGAVADGFIWGRGAIDVKFGVAALLEAASNLLANGFRPQRTLIISFGQDEEVGGKGAQAAAALLASRGVRLEMVLDEGGVIFWDGFSPLTASPVALVGTAEKGFEQIDVAFTSSGGHSSMPPLDGSDVAAQVARYVTYLRSHPLPPVVLAPVAGMLQAFGGVTPAWWLRPLLLRAGTWPLSWLFSHGLVLAGAQSAATVRNTVAVTWMRAGVANNVLPQQGSISINIRTIPGATQEQMLEYLRAAARATGVSAEVSPAAGHRYSPSAITSAAGPHFRLFKQAVQEVWQHNGKAIAVAPFLLVGMTDSRHFQHLSEHGVLRFIPAALNGSAGDLRRMHGTDERVPVDSYLRAICTYRRLMELFSAPIELSTSGGDPGVTAAAQ